MQQKNRVTRVLAYGVQEDKFIFWKDMLKGGLQSMHMGWVLLANCRNKPEEATNYIEECKDLEIVYLKIETTNVSEKLLKEVEAIAKALSEHPHRPWVCLSNKADLLRSVFEKVNIHVAQQPLEHAIHERWESQLPKVAV